MNRLAAHHIPFIAACLCVYPVHLAVAYAIVVGDNVKTLPFVLALVTVLPFASEHLRFIGKTRIHLAMGTVYYLIVTAYLLAVLYVAGPMGPVVYLGIFVYCAALYLLVRWQSANRILVGAAFLPALAHAAWLTPPVALALSGILFLSYLARRREGSMGLGPLPFAIMLFSFLVHTEAATFYKGFSFFDYFRSPDANAVTALSANNKLELSVKGNLGDPRFLLPGCNPGDLYLGVRKGKSALFLFQENNGQPLASALPGSASGDVAAIDCDRELLWTADYGGNSVLAFGASDLSQKQSITLPSSHPTFLVLGDGGRRLHVATDFDGSLHVFDTADGNWLRTLRAEGGIAHFAIDEKRDRVIAVTGGANLVTFDAPDWQPVVRRKIAGALILQVAYDSDHDRVYLSNFLTGMLYAMDAKTFEIQTKRWMGASIRFLCVLPGGHLAAANYFSGKITFLEGSTLSKLGGTYAGKRVRWMAFDPAGKRILTTSTYGPIAIPVDYFISE